MDIDKVNKVQKALIHSVPSLYVLNYRKIRGNPITFYSKKHPSKNRPWQIDILNDQHPDKCVRKSRQLGLSEMAVSEFIWFLDTHPMTNAIYTFPTKGQMEDFSNTRISPIFEESEYLETRLDKKMNNVRLKRLANGSALYLRSAFSSAAGEGVAGDMLGLDEYDRMGNGIELAFMESMKSSRYGYLRRWSTPTIPGRGVDLLFEKSDQRYYFQKCDRCGYWQVMDFEKNIVQVNPKGVDIINEIIENGTYEFQCQKCHKPFNRWNKGEYVAKFPTRSDRHGYHVSQLDAVWISADDIMRRQFQYKVKQLFYNYVIGMPYSSEGLIVTDRDVLNIVRFEKPITSRTPQYAKIVCGIDWGYLNWLVVLGITETEDVDILDIVWVPDDLKNPLGAVATLGAYMKPYSPDLIIADSGYGADRNTYLMQLFPGRMYSCDWDTSKNNIKLIDTWNDGTGKVRVDKTVKMKRVLYSVKTRRLGVFAPCEKLSMLIKHLHNVRIMTLEEDDVVYDKVTRIGDDHSACSLAYALIGVDRILEKHKPHSEMEFDYM